MLILIFIKSLQSVQDNIIHEEPGIYNFTLYAGKYTVSCYGAQGGDKCDGNKRNEIVGGKGAFTKGTMYITGKGTKFYAFVGGRGEMCNPTRNKGGFNGGGDSGYKTDSIYDARPGGGGGATDLRINDDSIKSRIMVAAGGSGAAWKCRGAYGGDKKAIYPKANNDFVESDELFGVDGRGGGGRQNDYSPGSGGGGGYVGGRGGDYATLNSYKAVGYSGTSYISSDDSDEPHELIKFQSPEVIVDYHEGNGSIEIIFDYVCKDKCSSCTSETDCEECYEGFLHEGDCLETCPKGYFEEGHSCVKCEKECETCSGSSTNCLTCIDGYYLYDNKCIEKCPPETATTESKECIKCDTPCKTCSTSPTECSSCIDNFVLHNNNCISRCPDGTFESNSVCESCDNDSHCKTCSSSKTCTSCSGEFFLYEDKCVNQCPEKMFGLKNVCVNCKSPCINCDSESACKSCIENYYLYDGKCYPTCPDGTSISGVNCVEDHL